MKRVFIAICLAATLLPHLATPAGSQELLNKIVAVVNEEIITLFELNRRIEPLLNQYQQRDLTTQDYAAVKELQKEMLNSMVEDMLMEQEAARLGVEVSQTEVESHLRQLLRSRNLSEEEFERSLRLQKMTRDEYAEQTRRTLLKHRLVNAMVRRKVVVTDEEVREYYEQNRDLYASDAEVDLGIILVSTQTRAQQIYNDVVAGDTTFEEAADEYSLGGAGPGGVIGEVPLETLASAWQRALEDVEPGGITEPFKVDQGYALLKLRGSVAADEAGVEAVRDEIEQALLKPKYQEEMENYLDKLRERAIVEIRL
jgi:peptidyl-prolyl cis-trans isomerase SurA